MKISENEYNELTEVFSKLYCRKIELQTELAEIEVKILESILVIKIAEKEVLISNKEFDRRIEEVLDDPRFTGNRLAAENIVREKL